METGRTALTPTSSRPKTYVRPEAGAFMETLFLMNMLDQSIGQPINQRALNQRVDAKESSDWVAD